MLKNEYASYRFKDVVEKTHIIIPTILNEITAQMLNSENIEVYIRKSGYETDTLRAVVVVSEITNDSNNLIVRFKGTSEGISNPYLFSKDSDAFIVIPIM